MLRRSLESALRDGGVHLAIEERIVAGQGLELFRTRYPRIKAALYWHERWQNADGSYSNLRVNSSVESLNAYREGVAHPDWLGDLILRGIPRPK